MAADSASNWYLSKDGKKHGPYSSQQLAALGKQGRISSDMAVWRQGMAEWQPVSKVRGLQVTAAQVPPPAPQTPIATVAVVPAPAAAAMPVTGHVTIEKTGKGLKLQQLLGLLCIVIGLVVTMAGVASHEPGSREVSYATVTGSLLLVAGIAWRIVTRVRIWWHHG